jgi:hypothetical protein
MARYLLPGVLAGLVCFAFSRVVVEPVIGRAIDVEAAGDHEHGHEIFGRAVQANAGAAVGLIVFATAMGALFVVAHIVLRAALQRRGHRPDPAGLALLLAAGMFTAVALVPALKYPANPPGVGLDDTMAVRSSTFLTMTVASVLIAVVATAVAVAGSRTWGGWRAAALAGGGYVAAMVVTITVLPGFDEVPQRFPAPVLAEFRSYSLLSQAVMWAVIGVVAAAQATRSARAEVGTSARSGAAYSPAQ